MLSFIHSNKLRPLAQELLLTWQQASSGPWQRPTIVVSDALLGQWLNLYYAELSGAAVGMTIRLPGEYIWSLLGEGKHLTPDRLRWHLLKAFGELADDQPFATLKTYLSGLSAAGQFQFADRLARQYDRYLVYRPDEVLGWEQGQGDNWQAWLWQRIAKDLAKHWAGAGREFIQNPQHVDHGPVLFLCNEPLSPSYLDLLQALGNQIDVALHLLNPTDQYWGDLRRQRRLPGMEDDGNESYGLIANLGQESRQFVDALINRHGADTAIEPDWPKKPNLLQRLQQEIYQLNPLPEQPQRITVFDQSISIDECHSPRRELEVIADRFVDALQNDPSLQVRDCLVLVPNLDIYAPAIHAVFGAAVQGRAVPYSVAGDRYHADDDSDFLLHLLDWLGGDMPLSGFVRLLQSGQFCRALELDEQQASWLAECLCELGVRWGINGQMRSKRIGVASAAFTFQQAVDRVLLGFACGTTDADLIHNLAPVDGWSVDAVAVFSRLSLWLQRAAAWQGRLQQSLPADEYVALIRNIAQRSFSAGHQGTLSSAYQALDALQQELLDYPNAIAVTVLIEALRASVQQRRGGNYLAGGSIQFAELGQQRGLPYRCIAVLGLDANQLPRSEPRLDFDLLREQPKAGDPDRRHSDRATFLDAILAAEDKLLLSYTGRSLQSNDEVAPSSLLNELLWDIDQRFCDDAGNPASKVLLHRQPMQPFSEQYAQSDSLFTYRQTMLDVSDPPEGFFDSPISADADNPNSIALADLLRWLRGPTAHWLQRQLHIQPRDFFCDREASEPNRIEQTANRLVNRLLAHTDVPDLAWWTQAESLPDGLPGQAILNDALKRAGPLMEARDPNEHHQRLHIDLGPYQLHGILDHLIDSGRQLVRAQLYPSDLLQSWAVHLLMCTAGEPCPEPVTRLIEKASKFDGISHRYFDFQADAQAQLISIIDLYRQSQTTPAPLYPAASYAYARAQSEGKAPEAAAITAWSEGMYPEGAGAEYRLIQYQATFDQRFIDISQQVCQPLLDAMQKGIPDV